MARVAGAAAYGLDPHVCEYILKPAFWILFFFLGIIWVIFVWAQLPATDTSHHQRPSAKDGGDIIEHAESTSSSPEENDSEDNLDTAVSHRIDDSTSVPLLGTAGCQSWKPQLTLWLAPALTSRTARIMAAMLYLLFLSAALVESHWLLVTFGRATSKMFRLSSISASRSPPQWVYGIYALVLGGQLLLDLVAFCVSACITVPWAVCIIELVVCMYPVPEVAVGDLNVKSKS